MHTRKNSGRCCLQCPGLRGVPSPLPYLHLHGQDSKVIVWSMVLACQVQGAELRIGIILYTTSSRSVEVSRLLEGSDTSFYFIKWDCLKAFFCPQNLSCGEEASSPRGRVGCRDDKCRRSVETEKAICCWGCECL